MSDRRADLLRIARRVVVRGCICRDEPGVFVLCEGHADILARLENVPPGCGSVDCIWKEPGEGGLTSVCDCKLPPRLPAWTSAGTVGLVLGIGRPGDQPEVLTIVSTESGPRIRGNVFRGAPGETWADLVQTMAGILQTCRVVFVESAGMGSVFADDLERELRALRPQGPSPQVLPYIVTRAVASVAVDRRASPP